MLKVTQLLVASALALSAAAGQEFPPTTGQATVNGRVLDEAGKPVQGATIDFLTVDHLYARAGAREKAFSQADGTYTITVPSPGKVKLYVYKPSLNIPKRSGIFEQGDEVKKEINVSDGAIYNGVDLQLPAPYGTLSVTVVDSKTHLPIPGGPTLVVRRLEMPSMSLSARGAGQFIYALPNRPITVSVEAGGYKPWHYVDPKTGNNYLKLGRSDSISLTVELAPTEAQSSP